MTTHPTVISLTGDLTLDQVAREQERLLAAARPPGTRLVLDLAHVPVITTPGLGLLLELHRLTHSHGGRLVCARATPFVQDVIRRTHLEQVLTIRQTLNDALAALDEG